MSWISELMAVELADISSSKKQHINSWGINFRGVTRTKHGNLEVVLCKEGGIAGKKHLGQLMLT